MIDQNAFFRNAALKISSSLDIEKALWRCLWYLQDIIPVNQIWIHLFDSDTGIAEAIAYATLESHQAVSIKSRMTRDSLQQIDEQRSIRVRRIPNTSRHPVTALLCPDLGCLGLSALLMDLVIEGEFLGVVSFLSFPDERFTKAHEHLIELLHEPFAIAVSNSVRYREIQKYKEQLEDENHFLHRELSRMGGEEVVGSEFGLKGVMELVRQVAPIDTPVLLLGETGVGKELIARTIHNLSRRCESAFIDVNCGAIPQSLMDSELFGHEKGAFTGAVSRKLGRFERAQGGTIFLDEIGELDLEAQVRLLRVLQERKLERVGGSDTIDLDIRVIAATHRDLEQMMALGQFREDLFFRLKIFPIVIPPLRERPSDIPSLVQHFLQKKSTQLNYNFPHKLTAGAMDRLIGYSWPGNVRELENTVERALILCNGGPMSFKEIIPSLSEIMTKPGRPGDKARLETEPPSDDDMNLDVAMARHIRQVLQRTEGQIDGKNGAARILGINPHTLRHRMKKLGVPFGNSAKTLYGRNKNEQPAQRA